MKSISQQIQNNPEAKKFLNEYCNGNVEYVAYFDQANIQSKGVTLSFDDFNPSHNMSLDNYQEKKNREGLLIIDMIIIFQQVVMDLGQMQKSKQNNMEMIGQKRMVILMNGELSAVNQILRNNLIAGGAQDYQNTECIDEFGNKVKVGRGIYFSNNIKVCIDYRYTNYTQIGNKQFAAILMTRVSRKKIKQSEGMKLLNYFVVNNSKDVRPYRLLLHEKLKEGYCFQF
ncbi:unnamed protein product (macronuclear) [Paramecium tetraurelia]|uniref:PARP catalytic domain-containing protein n=1 Tax=Paramecium tetraurelia TaxID=5888 RepID=A0C7F8_PARTE|nr:uncharacterized protein GSPATT00035855001 [Paramecium tetraurelia]CAK66725.1 unnamed protein product [Paramecium tetraurelia]|eukprot:XP_001434122.1 hypothetical protein (macronuclear) [Paramecium tetraurelia strain d4-2]